MTLLALIPARGGSKRLPRKNVKPLGGVPLIAWSIRSAVESGCCDHILVSTDDEEIATISREHGASVPWLRPSELASDTAASVDVALHALDAHESLHGPVDGIMLLQPTSPFRSVKSIRRAVEMFTAANARRPVVSLSRASSHPAWTFRICGDGLEPFLGWQTPRRSQDLEPAWMLNGSIYLTSPLLLRQERSFLTPDTLPLLIEQEESIDVDTKEDFETCELMLSRWNPAR